MKKTKIVIFSILNIFFLQVLLSAAKVIEIDGSSTVFPLTEAVAEEFQKKDKKIKITIGVSGTGGGFKKFGRGEIDINNASRAIKPTEVEVCKENKVDYIELPVAYDCIGVYVHPSNKWVNYLTVKELERIWNPAAEGRITKWNQIRKEFPDKEIRLYGPGTDSGTFDYFTEAICGKSGASRGDYVASEDDYLLVKGIATDPLGLGYFGLAYYEAHKEKLKVVPIDDENDANGKGPIIPSVKSVRDGSYQPLARPIFIYVNKKSAKRAEVAKFVEFYLENGAKLALEVGLVPLPDENYKKSLNQFKNWATK